VESSLTSGRVSNVAYSTNGVTAVFSVQRVEWKEAYRSVKVDFGMTDENPSGQYSISGIRSHDSLRLRLGRRQAAASSTIVYPSAPTTTPSSDSSVKNLNLSSTDPSLIPLGAITLGCKNCSLVGTLDITQGTFTVNSAANPLEEASQFIHQGFFNVAANGVSAHMELDTSVTLSQSFSVDIFKIPLLGFQVRIFSMLFVSQFSAI
jgi:hypothetical protein